MISSIAVCFWLSMAVLFALIIIQYLLVLVCSFSSHLTWFANLALFLDSSTL
jgi:hypothetical protein